MKLELNEYEVLALYDHLMGSAWEKPSDRNFDVNNIRDRLREHIITCLMPQKSSCEGCYEKYDADVKMPEYDPFEQKENLLGRWESSVIERLEEKASETGSENTVLDLLEEYDSQYPKGFRRSRNNKRKNKK